MRWITTKGRYVTADSKGRAQEIANEYNLGKLLHPAPTQLPSNIRPFVIVPSAQNRSDARTYART